MRQLLAQVVDKTPFNTISSLEAADHTPISGCLVWLPVLLTRGGIPQKALTVQWQSNIFTEVITYLIAMYRTVFGIVPKIGSPSVQTTICHILIHICIRPSFRGQLLQQSLNRKLSLATNIYSASILGNKHNRSHMNNVKT